MPMPADNTTWPPKPWNIAYAAWEENNAWYTGDTDALHSLYLAGRHSRPTYRVRGQEREGGLMGGITRFFWGRPVPADEHRTRLHIPAAADIATLSSDLLFAEPPRVTVDNDNRTQDRIDEIVNSDQTHAMWNQAGELASAFGAAAQVVTWDDEIADHVWIREVAADCCIPEFRYSRLTALTVWTAYQDQQTVWRHLERHEPGSIEHALYSGTATSLGRRVPLQDRPETEHYATLVDADSRIPTGTTRLTAAWMLNMPSKAWRKLDTLNAAGRSDYTGGTKALFDALDETWSSWMRDLGLGRARLVIPRAYLQNGPAGSPGSFDTDRELFTPVDVPGRTGELAINQVQFNIRVAEHQQTATALYDRILASAGFKDPDPDERRTIATATEVLDETRAKERNRDKKALYAKDAIARVTAAALAVDAAVFPGKGGRELDNLPTVVFPKVSQQDPEKTSRTLSALAAAGAASIETLVRMRDENLTDEQVDEEVARIKQEKGMDMPDPATLGRS